LTFKKLLCFAALCLAVVTPAFAQETGVLQVRFEYGGQPIAPKPIMPIKDAPCCSQQHSVSEKLLVNPENKGIKNVVVYLHTGRGGSDLPDVSPKNETRVLTMTQCRFDPLVVLAQVGDTLKVTNRGPVGHCAKINFFRNSVLAYSIPTDGPRSFELRHPEPAPIPVDCNIYPWMRAYVVVLEHPFAAKSDENGELLIKGLPAGEELHFRVFHEAGRVEEVTIDGEHKTWARGRFTAEIEPGMNDLGTVVILGDALETPSAGRDGF